MKVPTSVRVHIMSKETLGGDARAIAEQYARRVMQESAGLLKQAYLSARQRADSGITFVSNINVPLANGVMCRYSMNNGLEYMDVYVDAAAALEDKKVIQNTLPDYAVITTRWEQPALTAKGIELGFDINDPIGIGGLENIFRLVEPVRTIASGVYFSNGYSPISYCRHSKPLTVLWGSELKATGYLPIRPGEYIGYVPDDYKLLMSQYLEGGFINEAPEFGDREYMSAMGYSHDLTNKVFVNLKNMRDAFPGQSVTVDWWSYWMDRFSQDTPTRMVDFTIDVYGGGDIYMAAGDVSFAANGDWDRNMVKQDGQKLATASFSKRVDAALVKQPDDSPDSSGFLINVAERTGSFELGLQSPSIKVTLDVTGIPFTATFGGSSALFSFTPEGHMDYIYSPAAFEYCLTSPP